MNALIEILAGETKRKAGGGTMKADDIIDRHFENGGFIPAYEWSARGLSEPVLNCLKNDLALSGTLALGQVFLRENGTIGGVSTSMALREALSLLSRAIREKGNGEIMIVGTKGRCVTGTGLKQGASMPGRDYVVGEKSYAPIELKDFENPLESLKAAVVKAGGEDAWDRVRREHINMSIEKAEKEAEARMGAWDYSASPFDDEFDDEEEGAPSGGRPAAESAAMEGGSGKTEAKAAPSGEDCACEIPPDLLDKWMADLKKAEPEQPKPAKPAKRERKRIKVQAEVRAAIDFLKHRFPGKDAICAEALAAALNIARSTFWRMRKRVGGADCRDASLQFADAAWLLARLLTEKNPLDKAFWKKLPEELRIKA